ncbi:MAG: hypothetical protein L0027_02465 [Candidatus Rokubacteria bacterium]|nr:hypothetical protein [Candidatus Rokubacteria bacterium]
MALLAGCNTQRYPGPMPPLVDPLPRGEIPPPPYGPQEILVFRLSDPVLVRRAGEASAYPLAVYEKRDRLKSGSSVLCAAGGRCELLWPNDASSVLVFDDGMLDLGEPSRDEPLVSFRTLTRARLDLTPEDRVALMGGAVLRGDPEDRSGPFLVERTRGDLLKVTNQSKRECTLAFREEELVLSPGEVLSLPLLHAGGAPAPRDPDEQSRTVSGREVFVVGEVAEDGAGLRAVGSAVVRDRGVVVRLGNGESVVLSGLLEVVEPADAALAPPPSEAPPAEPVPAPEETPVETPPPADEAPPAEVQDEPPERPADAQARAAGLPMLPRSSVPPARSS